ncbi:MAG: AAA family ATPase [Saprospiraceae bacterium]|nr:AAA family ATPase [Saprospiraceae bacterium]
MDAPGYRLEAEHHYVLECLKQNRGNYFLTGKAGCGKSTLLQVFRNLTDAKVIYLAPTGIAAIQIKGQTIHSFFRLPSHFIRERDYRMVSKSLLKGLRWIVIDEISMVRADLMDHIDAILRASLRSSEPFGGVPMFWVGDLYQLPPVVSTPEERQFFSSQYESPYFFSSRVFSRLKSFEMIELSHVFRQSDPYFLKLLNKIRSNELDEDELADINERCLNGSIASAQGDGEAEHFRITLCTTNARASRINLDQLARLPGNAVAYQAKVTGKLASSHFPADEVLLVKPGAQVMLLRNDSEGRYVNGSLATVVQLEENAIGVKLEGDDAVLELERESWELIRYMPGSASEQGLQMEVTGRFRQFPIKLAWAVTIHKSQGKTFDRVTIDMGSGAFECGQAYVALSRCTRIEGIRLLRPLRAGDLRTDDRIVDFMRRYS